MDFSSNSDLIRCEIKINKNIDIYNRTYKKIQDIFAQLGGIISIIVSFCFIITKPLQDMNFYKDLVN